MSPRSGGRPHTTNGHLNTGGSDGLTLSFNLLGEVDLFGIVSFRPVNITDPIALYFLCLLVFAASMYALWRLANSLFGPIGTAIRGNRGRAEALGIDVTRHS